MTTVSIKFLSRSEPPDRIVLLTTLLWVPLSLPGALTVWRWPDSATWPWLVLSGFPRHRRALLLDARAAPRRRIGARAFQLHAASRRDRARLDPVRRNARRVHRDRCLDHRRRDALHRTARGDSRAQARRRSAPPRARSRRYDERRLEHTNLAKPYAHVRLHQRARTRGQHLRARDRRVADAAHADAGARKRLAAPGIGYTYNSNVDENGFIWRIDNNGVGPARIETVTLTLDGKPMKNWPQVLMRSASRASGAYRPRASPAK